MKRELAYMLEVQSQLVGSVGQNISCMTPSPPETRATCCTEAESVCAKRFRVTEVNGFIVYTRLKKSRINGCSELRENPVNGGIKSLEEPRLDSTSSSIEEEGRATDTVVGKNPEWDKEIQDNHLVDSGIEAGIVAEAVNRKEPNGSAVEEEGVGLGNADCIENVPLLRQYSRDTLKMKVTTEAADGRASSQVEPISRSEQSTADKEGVVEAPLNFAESSKPPKRFTRSALKLMEEQVEVTVHGMQVIDSKSNCREICAVESISMSEQSPSEKEGLDEAPLNFTESSKPPRRFTRSALKPKEEPVEVTVRGMEEIDREATSRIDVETIAEGSALATPKKNLELKMSKKISLDKKPMTVKELFDTGLLEGVPVIYMGGKKAFGLRGTIKDVGILCSCSLCKGCRVIPPSQFEIHACNQYRRAAQYVCFENGKSLLDVLKACRAAPLHELEATIQSAISSSAEDRSFICIKCKGSFPPNCVGKLGPLCISCTDSKESEDGPSCVIVDIRTRLPEPESDLIAKLPKNDSTCDSPQHSELKITRKSSKTDFLAVTCKSASMHKPSRVRSQWKTTPKSIKTDLISKALKSASVAISSMRKSQRKSAPKSSKSAVVSESLKNASACASLQNKYQWKRTTKDQRLHKLVFEEDGLPDGTEVAYYGRGQKLLEGYKKGFGIFCRCCNCEVSPSQFEVHAGWASRKKPYSYIYLSNGVSLHELAISLSKGRKYSAKDNDDVCVICADGGNLLLCDGCPRAFHKDCASLSSVPRGDWYCKYCENMFQREKFVEHNANAVAAGRVSGIDPVEQLTKRCIRIVKSIEQELSGCGICRCPDFSKSGFGPRTIILCDQCEKEYHVGCLKTHKIANLKELPKGKWFCCADCSKIHSTMQKLLICDAEKLPDSFLNVLKKKHKEKGLGTITDVDVRWRLLSSKIASSETRSLLSQAVGIFHECFDPIVDSATGRDLIPYMVYGRNLKGQEYGGMHCALLTVNSTVVSAGILRVFGREVAELPLVATSNDNHGKGYFQLLFSCIEKLLGVLNVKSLVLPAAAEAESIWTDRFGFQKIKPDQLSRYRKSCCQMVTFQGTSMLHKSIPACSFGNKSTGGFIESCCAVE